MGFTELNNLQNHLASLQNDLSSYKSQLSTMKKRKSDVETIISNQKKVCNNRCDDVTAYLNKISGDLGDALKGTKTASNLSPIVKSDKELDISIDNNMFNALSQMNSELEDIKRKITELETKISSANMQISNCKASISSQKHSIAANYESTYNNTLNKFEKAEKAYKSNPSDSNLKKAYDLARKNRDSARNNYYKYYSWL